MKRRAGPEFRQQRVPLKACPGCQGKGTQVGVFYEMPCVGCNAGGFVHGKTGEALALEDLVLQLRLQLNQAHEHNKVLSEQLLQYDRTQRATGGMFTGD